MKSLKEFIAQRDATEAGKVEISKSKDLIASTLRGAAIPEFNAALSVNLFTRGNKEQKFAKDLVDTAHSEAFLSEFSQTIGKPGSDETEDEFVSRAKSAFKALLTKKLGK